MRLRPAWTLPALAALTGCGDPSCLRGGDDCVVLAPCADLAFTCDSPGATVRIAQSASDLPGGMAALGAIGDYVLENGQVTAVIEAVDHPHNQAITGGSVIDLAIRGKDNDSLRHYWQATGLLPWDYVEYTSSRVVQEGDTVAVQFDGHLQGRPDTPVHTRYELGPCDPGLRIRTEIVNLEREPSSWALVDGFYFGGRENLAFAPFPGGGFNFRSFGLSELTEVMTPVPYVVAAMHAQPAATYAAVACSEDELHSFLTEEVTPVGLAPALVMPRDWLVFERFLGVVDGQGVSAGADLALEIREQLFDEPYTTVSGTVSLPPDDGGAVGQGLRALVTVSEGTARTPSDERIPWTMAIPDETGHFEVRVPTDRDYVAEVEAFGHVVAEAEVSVGSKPADFGTLSLPVVADLTVSATIDGVDDGEDVLVIVYPSDDATDAASRGRMLGHFDECAPLLGNPHSGSPACNRILVREGEDVTVAMVPGTYELVAVAGPFSTLAHAAGVGVEPGTGQSVHLDLQMIDGLQPAGTLSGDFHVHGRSSFDSSLSDIERMRSFLAAKTEVIASTEHDVVYDYAAELAELDAADRLQVVVGTEMTGAVLWIWNEPYGYPQVVGHWNVWPLTYDPTAPYRGAPWDELAEPGMLLTRAEDVGWPADVGVAQLNHPIGGAQFGRDFGWISATKMRADLPPSDDPLDPQGLFGRTPKGSRFANDAYHVQEVMNGTGNFTYLPYRDFWFYLLNHGVLRGGTANSDTHTLTENVLGFPRTLVWANTQVGAGFDEVAFDAAIREGRMIGTNGPVVLVSTTDANGGLRTPSLDVFSPSPSASVEIEVRAAPWVAVTEVRIWVNGALAKVIDGLPPLGDPTEVPTDPDALVRLQTQVPLSELVPGTGDAWIVVEAGTALVENADLDCDGWVDTGDNDGNGKIDWRDVAEAEEEPDGGCFEIGDAGPLADPAAPELGTPEWAFWAAVPLGYPLAFTNPLLIDGDGNGTFDGVTR